MRCRSSRMDCLAYEGRGGGGATSTLRPVPQVGLFRLPIVAHLAAMVEGDLQTTLAVQKRMLTARFLEGVQVLETVQIRAFHDVVVRAASIPTPRPAGPPAASLSAISRVSRIIPSSRSLRPVIRRAIEHSAQTKYKARLRASRSPSRARATYCPKMSAPRGVDTCLLVESLPVSHEAPLLAEPLLLQGGKLLNLHTQSTSNLRLMTSLPHLTIL